MLHIMKKALTIFTLLTLLISACGENTKKENQLTFGISSEYPPFEFKQDGELVGFDIDIARAVAEEMGMQASFKDMKFASILPSIENGIVAAGISAINITPQRTANFDFTTPYHYFSIAGIFRDSLNIESAKDLSNKKIACQIGTSSESWIKITFPGKEFVSFDGTNQAVEYLKSGRGDVVIVDGEVAVGFAMNNPGYKYIFIGKSYEGIGIALKKGSPLVIKMNEAIEAMKQNGKLKAIKDKWKID